MAKQIIPEGHREVTVPPNYKGKIITVDDEGNRKKAVPGDKVILSAETLKRDQHLAQFATDATPAEKKDFYSNATTDSLRKALKTRDLDVEGDRKELILTAREQGVPKDELEFMDQEVKKESPVKPPVK